MLGYGLIIVCGLAMAIEAALGYVLAVQSEDRVRRNLFKAAFLIFALFGLTAMIWGDWRVWFARQDRQGVADIELTNTAAERQLQRIATVLGVNSHAPVSVMADDIVRHLPSSVWHMPQVRQTAFGQALDEIPRAARFKVVVRSIPSNANSIAFSDDVLAVLKAHGWVAESRRDFGINTTITGLVIAVSRDTTNEDDVPRDAKKLITMLEKAGFTPYGAPLPELQHGQFELVVGRAPK